VSRHGATKVTPFELVFGQEAMLPVEVNMQACRVGRQNDVIAEEYMNVMMDKLDRVPEEWFRAMMEIEKEKLQTTRAYNKKVREKSFQVGDLLWKTILPLGMRDQKFGKWSPNWEGPYRVAGIVLGNAYFVEDLEGKGMAKALDGKYLKRHYPNIWQGA
jgi:hypothetical protein